ncbi:hypothetical protein ACFE04_025359 [Oxalis oulophora]
MKNISCFLVAFGFLVVVSAHDPSPLQDFCVATNDAKNGVIVNGKLCKDPNIVTPEDFFFSGLDKAGNISYPPGSKVTLLNVEAIPGLNTLGVAMARVDYAPKGQNPPHTHPRATEIMTVLQGTLKVGFITSAPSYKHFTKILNKGDVFVFPEGLVHYQVNIGKKPSVVIVGYSSQNPGLIVINKAIELAKSIV